MSANFTPVMGGLVSGEPFRFWCQKVLPLVYDDSLSYYELLSKVGKYLNNMLEDMNTLSGDITALHNAYEQLEEYVNTYFDNIDIQEEVNNKLDSLAQEGFFDDILTPMFNTYKGQIDDVIEEQQEFITTNVSDRLDAQDTAITNRLDAQDTAITNAVQSQNATIGQAISSQNNTIASNNADVNSRLNSAVTQQNDRITILEERMTEYASLPSGSTSGNAELIDIRVGADGVTYASAGDAVRANDRRIGNLADGAIVKTTSHNLFNGSFVKGEGIRQTDGEFVSDAGYSRTGFIPVKAGTAYIGIAKTVNVARVFTHFATYDTNHNFIRWFTYQQYPTVTTVNDISYQTVPIEQDGYIAFTIQVAATDNNLYMVSQSAPTAYEGYFTDSFKLNTNLDGMTKIMESMTYGVSPSVRHSTSLQAGESLSFDTNSVMKNQVMTFFGKINSFNAVLLGHGTGAYGYYIMVDDTNIYYMSNSAIGTTVAHGLTISDYIYIEFKIDYDYNVTTHIVTRGGQFTDSRVINLSTKGNVFCSSSGSSFTNVVFTWNSYDYKKALWAFGDSWFTLYSSSRWPYYLREWGYDTCLLNAYPGEASENAYYDLEHALTHGTPKYLFWCIGMNDHDTENSVNDVWLKYAKKVETLCDKLGITLIYCTIPVVSNTSYNNTYKNQYIRSSGKRYVDLANALSGVSGWEQEDGGHPNEIGARMIASYILSALPEIRQKS